MDDKNKSININDFIMIDNNNFQLIILLIINKSFILKCAI